MFVCAGRRSIKLVLLLSCFLVSLGETRPSMVYQLPNGKVINISLDEFLELNDDDIQYLMSIDAGEYAASPLYGSGTRSRDPEEDDDEECEIPIEDFTTAELDFGNLDFQE